MGKWGRRITVRVLVLLATCITTFGFSLTGSYLFLLVPPVAVTILAVIVQRWHKESAEPADGSLERYRRILHVQVAVMLVVLSGLLIYSAVMQEKHRAIGYLILWVEIAVMIILVILEYMRSLRRSGGRRTD